jgi:hypothetical protein
MGLVIAGLHTIKLMTFFTRTILLYAGQTHFDVLISAITVVIPGINISLLHLNYAKI